MDASATDIERMKAELALKDEQIKHEQARVLALELQIKLRERDERIERLERELKESAEKAPRSSSRGTPQSYARAPSRRPRARKTASREGRNARDTRVITTQPPRTTKTTKMQTTATATATTRRARVQTMPQKRRRVPRGRSRRRISS